MKSSSAFIENNPKEKGPHLLKHRFVVVDIVHSDDDTCGGGERVRAA